MIRPSIQPLAFGGLFASAALAMTLAAAPASAQPGMMDHGMHAGAMGDPATMDFVKKAAQSDEFEVQEGRLAETRAHSPAVKAFARKMVSAHTMTTANLKSAIRTAGMTPPPPPPLRDDQMQMMADLRGMQGSAFDAAYIDQQVKAHEEALGVMQGYAQSGTVKPIAMAAAKTAPLVQSHLDMAHGLQSKMGGR